MPIIRLVFLGACLALCSASLARADTHCTAPPNGACGGCEKYCPGNSNAECHPGTSQSQPVPGHNGQYHNVCVFPPRCFCH